MSVLPAKPLSPRLVLALSIVGPGLGHLATGRTSRALGFAFSTVLFAILTWKLSPPGHSFVGQHAGGLFIWALSVPDAYRHAKLKHARWVNDAGRVTSSVPRALSV